MSLPRSFTTVPPIPALRLGVLLLHQGSLTSTQLGTALTAQRVSGRKLGDELQLMGLADAETVLRGLSAQAGVSYLTSVDPSCVKSAPGGLSSDEVRALGVVPIHVDSANRLLVVACQAPLPRAALNALRQLTGWTPEPLLVTDANYHTLLKAYAAAAAGSPRHVAFARVRDVDDAAARIAAAAAVDRSVTMTEVHSAGATWVRVEGAEFTNTLLVSDQHEEDETCRVATMSH